ncbi:hypothetical protein [Salinibacter ruber]|uniref:hypothetical protein n=1 Tax=Salinibacter ruber TaxID=146919 RepID=UPI000E56D5E1|nr:hypothetical protein [Salinibacter ruber]
MRTRLRSAALLLAFTLVGAGLLGCDQGGTSPPMTAEEARRQIIESASGLQGAAATFEQTPLARLSEAMMTSGSEGRTVSPWGKALTSGLGAVLDTTGGNFNYDASTGVYVWNPDTQAWRQERPADSLILRFPESKGAPSNNATFTLSRYETQSVPILGPTEEVPTRVGASLSVDSTEVFALDLKDVSFMSIFGIPKSFSLDITADSHITADSLTYTTSLKDSQGRTYEFRDDLRNNGQLVTATTATVDLSPDDAEVEGTTQVGQDLAIRYTADVGTPSAFEDASADEISDRVSVDVLLQGNQVATLRYDGSAEQVIVAYTDGTTEPLSDLLREIGVPGGAS